MNRMVSSFICATVCAGLLAGCGHVPKDAGFSDVRQLTSDRIGLTVQWNSHTGDDQAADRAVDKLLSAPLVAPAAAQIALLNNHHLQAEFEDLGIAQADLVQAGLLKNPVFDLGVRFPDRAPASTYLDIAVAEDFLDVALLPARKKLAQAQFEEAKAKTTDQVLTLVAQTYSEFYDYQAAQRLVDLRTQMVQAFDASLEVAQRLHDAGNITDLQLARERAQAAQAKADLIEFQADADEAREKLNSRMGLADAQTYWALAAAIADVPPGDFSESALESAALESREDLAAARQEIAVQARSLGLTADYRYIDKAELGPEFEHETDGQWRIGPRLSIPIPLFDQGNARIARAQAMLRQSEQRYQAMRADAASEVRLNYTKMAHARQRALKYHDDVIPTQQEVFDQTQLQYNGMFVGVFDLLEARRQQFEAQAGYVQALRDYWTARAQLQQAVGGRFPSVPTTQISGDQP